MSDPQNPKSAAADSVPAAESPASAPAPSTSTESGQPSGTAPVPPPAKRAGASTGPLRGLLSLLVLALLLAAGGYLWLQQQAQQTALAALAQQLDDQQGQWQGQAARVNQQLERELARQGEARTAELNALRAELASTDRRLQVLSASRRDDWKLVEAEYLLRLANQRLLIERDSATALVLVQGADNLLQALDDRQLHPVRRALAQDMAALALVEPIDREGLYLRLLALIEQTSDLSVTAPLGQEISAPDTLEPLEVDAPPRTWRHRIKASFARFMQRLNQHLRVRTHSTLAVDAILPPENQVYLNQNLRLMLEQAQSALLREDELVYQSSLARAQAWLARYYQLNPKAAQLHAELVALEQTSIRVNLPELGPAQELLRSHIERRGAEAQGAEARP